MEKESKKNYIVFFLLVLFLESCTMDTPIIQAPDFKITKAWKKVLLDSLKIESVIDNRSNKDSIIGYDYINNIPLMIDTPLVRYLKNSLIKFIVKDTTLKKFNPVNVYINEYKIGINNLTIGEEVHHKFSYLFTFLNDSNKIEKVQITDSLSISTPFYYELIPYRILNGLWEVSSSFIWYYNNVKLKLKDSIFNSNAFAELVSKKEESQPDSINYINLRFKNSQYKWGQYLRFLKGDMVKYAVSLGRIDLHKRRESQFEFEFEHNLTFISSLKPNTISREGILLYSLGYCMDYNLFKNTNVLFLNGGLSLNIGVETVNGDATKLKLPLGPILEESVGFHIIDQIILRVGAYQLFLLNSNTVPHDLGLVLSLSFTGVY